MNFLDSGTLNCLTSPEDICTTRVLPSACKTVPLNCSVVTFASPLIVSFVICGACWPVAVSEKRASTIGMVLTPDRISWVVVDIFGSPIGICLLCSDRVRRPPCKFPHHRGGRAALISHLFGDEPVHLDQTGNTARPSGLMAGADAGAIVAMEVFVEQDQISPVGIVLEFLCTAIHRAAAGCIALERLDQPF